MNDIGRAAPEAHANGAPASAAAATRASRRGEREDSRRGEREDSRRGEREDSRRGEREDSRPESAFPRPLRRLEQPTAFARWQSRVKRLVTTLALPRTVLVTRGKAGTKKVALTFDDGPDAMTPRYLDLCDELGLRATFFLVGANIERAPHMVREYVRRGHEVAGHGYTHRPLPSLSYAVLVDELARTDDMLPPGLAPRPLVRPPGGRISPGAVLRVAAAGYTTVLWSLDSDDCRTRDPREVEARVSPSNVTSGEIVLMHEMQTWTLEALPPIVEGLRGEGFELVTVSELLGY